MAVSLKDVARKAGVSVPTASLILNNRNMPFKQSTRQAVLDAVESLSYRPDSIARRTGTGRRDAIGLLVRSESPSRVSNSPAYEAMCGINDVMMEQQQFLVLLKVAQLTPGKAPGLQPRIISERFVDGIIVEKGLPAEMERAILQYGIPTVWLNSSHHDEFDCVYPDEKYAGQLITKHLIEAGHRRILFVSPVVHPTGEMYYSLGHRQEGYEKEMIAHGLKPAVVGVPDATSGDGDNAVRYILDRRDSAEPITAVVAHFAETIKLRQHLQEGGLNCPKDISLASVEDLHIFRRDWPEITGVTCDRYGLGREAAKMMLAKVTTQKLQPSQSPRGEIYPGRTVRPIESPAPRKSRKK